MCIMYVKKWWVISIRNGTSRKCMSGLIINDRFSENEVKIYRNTVI